MKQTCQQQGTRLFLFECKHFPLPTASEQTCCSNNAAWSLIAMLFNHCSGDNHVTSCEIFKCVHVYALQTELNKWMFSVLTFNQSSYHFVSNVRIKEPNRADCWQRMSLCSVNHVELRSFALFSAKASFAGGEGSREY